MCCAYSGRIAAAYRMGGVKVDPSGDSGSNRRVNLCVSIYECESTGGSDWKLEDTIELRDIDVSQPQVSFDLSYLSDLVDSMYPDSDPGSATAPTLIPSPSTLQSIKKSLTEVELNRRRGISPFVFETERAEQFFGVGDAVCRVGAGVAGDGVEAAVPVLAKLNERYIVAQPSQTVEVLNSVGDHTPHGETNDEAEDDNPHLIHWPPVTTGLSSASLHRS